MRSQESNRHFHDAAGGVFLDDETLSRLRVSTDRAQFAGSWLKALSKLLDGFRQGVLVVSAPGSKRYEPLAVMPDNAKPERALMTAVDSCLRGGRTMMITGSAEKGEGAAIAVPVSVGGEIRGIVGVMLDMSTEENLRLAVDQMQWASGWIETLLRRGRIAGGEGLATVVELMATALHHRRFDEAAMASVTELANFLNCERAGIGFMRGRHARLRALSHSANFGKRSSVVRRIEAAMDEALDQKATIVVPELPDAPERATLNHEALQREQGMSAICTVPMSEGNRVIGALLLERAEPFDRATVQLCEYAAALLGPTLDVKRREDRWLPAKTWEATGNALAALFGRRHALLKLITVALIAAAVFFWTATGTYRVSGDATVEGRVQRAVSVPVAGYLSDSGVRAGDMVRAGDVIATLDMTDLRLEKLKWSSEREKQIREYSEALAQKERARARILDAQIAQADAQLALLDQQLARMRVTAPFDGLIVSGDLSQSLGSPVERGDVLFEIAPLDGYRVRLKVDERDVGDIAVGQRGTLALAAMPDERIGFEVTRITPVSTAEDGKNLFHVEGVVDPHDAALLRPGMEGVGKVEVDDRRLIWIWTRKLILWAKLFVWSWTP